MDCYFKYRGVGSTGAGTIDIIPLPYINAGTPPQKYLHAHNYLYDHVIILIEFCNYSIQFSVYYYQYALAIVMLSLLVTQMKNKK